MKRIILTVAAVFAFGFANAQDSSGSKDDKSGMRFGIKAGANFSSLNVDSEFEGDTESLDESRTSFYAGGLLDFGVSEKFHVQPEVLYSAEGGDNVKLEFIRVPIMAKYYLTEGLNIQAGPQIGFKIGGDEGIDDGTKSTDWGLGFGAAFELNSLFIDARYNIGLTDLSDIDGVEVNTGCFQVGLGFIF